MNLFKTENPPFLDNIHEHLGTFIGVRGGLQCWQLQDPTIEPFSSITERTCAELARCHFPRSSVVIFEYYICGMDLAQAAVYIVLHGASKCHRKRAVRRLKKSCLTQDDNGLKFDQWDWPSPELQVVMKGLPSWPRPPAPLIYESRGYQIWFDGLTKALTIGTGTTSSNNQSGVISRFVDGRMYGFDNTVFIVAPAHIFLPKQDEEDSPFPEGSSTGESTGSGSQSDSNNSSHDIAVETSPRFNMLRAGSATPLEFQAALSRSGSIAEATSSIPTSPSKLSESYNYSEALSKGSLDLNQVIEQTDAGHASTHDAEIPFAYVTSRALDYVLIPIHYDTYIGKLSRGNSCMFSNENTMDFRSADIEGTGTVVGTITLPSFPCPITGTISTRPTMMRLPLGRNFSCLHAMHLPVPVQQGESGSIVLDPFSGKAYGIVVSGSVEGKVVYVVPAVEVLKDIAHRLGMNRLDRMQGLGRQGEKAPSVSLNQDGGYNHDEPASFVYWGPFDGTTKVTVSGQSLPVQYGGFPTTSDAAGSTLWASGRTIPWEVESTTSDDPLGWNTGSLERYSIQDDPPSSTSSKRPRSSIGLASGFDWAEAEKRFLLAEVLKSSDVETQALLDIVTTHDITIEWQDWFAMKLPPGRAINECAEILQALKKDSRLSTGFAEEHGQAASEKKTVRPQMATWVTATRPSPDFSKFKGKGTASNETVASSPPAISPTQSKRTFGQLLRAEEAGHDSHPQATPHAARQLYSPPPDSHDGPGRSKVASESQHPQDPEPLLGTPFPNHAAESDYEIRVHDLHFVHWQPPRPHRKKGT